VGGLTGRGPPRRKCYTGGLRGEKSESIPSNEPSARPKSGLTKTLATVVAVAGGHGGEVHPAELEN